jgi:hypothetical protein
VGRQRCTTGNGSVGERLPGGLRWTRRHTAGHDAHLGELDDGGVGQFEHHDEHDDGAPDDYDDYDDHDDAGPVHARPR